MKLLLDTLLVMISLGSFHVVLGILIRFMPQLLKFIQLLIPLSPWLWWRGL